MADDNEIDLSSLDDNQLIKVLNDFEWDPEEIAEKVNIFDILGISRKETVSSDIWAYFFDSNNQHGLGSLFGDCLLEICKTKGLKNEKYKLGQSWCAQTEVSKGSDTLNRVDIVLTGGNIAFAIENKVDAELYNPLDDYKVKIKYLSNFHDNGISEDDCYVVVLHEHKDVNIVPGSPADNIKTEYFSVSYQEMIDCVRQHIGEYLLEADNNAVTILKMFIYNFEERRRKMSEHEKIKNKLVEINSKIDGGLGKIGGFLEKVYQIGDGDIDWLKILIDKELKKPNALKNPWVYTSNWKWENQVHKYSRGNLCSCWGFNIRNSMEWEESGKKSCSGVQYELGQGFGKFTFKKWLGEWVGNNFERSSSEELGDCDWTEKDTDIVKMFLDKIDEYKG
ncbi:MAG: PD-(D/E)XK nuclease family protein [Candidatus Ancillula sp.]|jgi:hypothetical protein|nr:PD-(D/E)XK nuclease family protein [Candidatus Ancillula sp.]